MNPAGGQATNPDRTAGRVASGVVSTSCDSEERKPLFDGMLPEPMVVIDGFSMLRRWPRELPSYISESIAVGPSLPSDRFEAPAPSEPSCVQHVEPVPVDGGWWFREPLALWISADACASALLAALKVTSGSPDIVRK